MVQYKEVQKFDQWWMKALLGLSSSIMMGGILMGYFQQASALPEGEANDLLVDYLMIMIAVGIAIAALIFFILSHRLELEINPYRLRYKFFPWVDWKTVEPGKVKGFEIKKAQQVSKFGGWGLRYNPFIGQWAYLVKGRYAMILHFTNGKTITMTTTRPQELQSAMEAFLAKNEMSVNV